MNAYNIHHVGLKKETFSGIDKRIGKQLKKISKSPKKMDKSTKVFLHVTGRLGISNPISTTKCAINPSGNRTKGEKEENKNKNHKKVDVKLHRRKC